MEYDIKTFDLKLRRAIQDCINNVEYRSSEFTKIHKLCVYEAIQKLLNENPKSMIDYMLFGSRTGGFQHKIFQSYINLLETKIPFSFIKNDKKYTVDSLLDEQLCIFDGISVFDGIIDDKLEIKNNTSEIYIGGRSAAYVKPFYIGKILEVINKSNDQNLTHKIKEYTFSSIKMSNVQSNTEVKVTHLRIPPHYQMGGMVYVNRARKEIIKAFSDYESS